jgi:hypothetical protein
MKPTTEQQEWLDSLDRSDAGQPVCDQCGNVMPPDLPEFGRKVWISFHGGHPPATERQNFMEPPYRSQMT